jgi:coiled-coil domain-containing protein 151
MSFMNYHPQCHSENDEDDDEYGEVPDREAMKHHTAQLLNAKNKNKQQKKTKKKKSADDQDDD